jgi:hypothetical protein
MIDSLISSVLFTNKAFAWDWIFAQNGERGSRSVGGSYVENDNYFVCAGRTPNGFQAGHLGLRQSICYVAWGESYIRFSSY